MTKRDVLTAEGIKLGYQLQMHVIDGEIWITEKPNPLISSAVDKE